MSDHRPFALAGARPQYGPDKTVDVKHIDLHLRPDLGAKVLHGVCATTIVAIEAGVHSVRMDAIDLTIDKVTRDGADLTFASTSRALTIEFAIPLAAAEQAIIVVHYRAEQPRRGLYFIDTPRQAWTQSQDQDARYWFPCFDHPAEKQSTSATIVVPRGLFALGNGELISRTDDGDSTVFRYEQLIPHATYLVTMVAGTFAEVKQPHNGAPVLYYVVPGREDDGERSFGNTPRMIDCFEQTLGVQYPYARYSQIAVADFIFGGMENTSATTQTDRTLHDARAHLDFSSDPLVSHELAHQWFGDLVTCRDWSQAWLNEGFATFFEAVWREANLGWDEYQYDIFELVADYLEEDSERYRRPIVCNDYRDPIELFDRHLYQKAGAVLHMLCGELGWERMRRSLKRYLTDNAQRNVETIDLVRAIEATTGRNMRGFFAQWIERGGHPEIEVGYRWDEERKSAIISIDQKQTVDDATPAYLFDLEIGLVAETTGRPASNAGAGTLAGETRVKLHVEHKSERYVIPLDRAPGLIRIDPGTHVLCDMTFAFDADLCATILRAEPSPVMRIRAAKALAKDGSRVAREALAAALANDPFWGVATEVAGVLGSMRAPSARDALLANIAHPSAKARTAIARALGNYHDADVATALLALRDDASYFVVAAAYESLGKTRDARAFAALSAGLAVASWSDTIAAGAARGLGELADERAFAPLLNALEPANGEALRRAAVGAIARLGARVDSVRGAAIDVIDRLLTDPSYLVRVSAYAAAEKIADARLLGSLDRLSASESDGRLRRDAAEAAIRVREAQKVPAEVAQMREELEKLRVESRTLRERLDEFAQR